MNECESVCAVSYTHLDVYKRQVSKSTNGPEQLTLYKIILYK